MLRLTSASDFERVRRDGRSHAHPLVVLAACRRKPPELPPAGPGQAAELRSRLGVVAGRAVGTAVARNRAKRLLREAARRCPVGPGWDLVLIARAPLAKAGLPEAWAAVSQLLQRAGVAAKQVDTDG